MARITLALVAVCLTACSSGPVLVLDHAGHWEYADRIGCVCAWDSAGNTICVPIDNQVIVTH